MRDRFAQEYVHPHTGRRVTVQELVDFASAHLGAETMFWCTEEPYYTRDVLPGLSGTGHPCGSGRAD